MQSPKIGKEPIKDKEKKNIFKRRKKDDMGNKGRRGKGPKPMDVDVDALNTPIVKPINTEFLSRGKFNLEKQDKLNVQRFQGSTKPLGNIKPIQSMLTNKIKKGLSAASTFKPSKRDMELKEAHLGTTGKNKR